VREDFEPLDERGEAPRFDVAARVDVVEARARRQEGFVEPERPAGVEGGQDGVERAHGDGAPARLGRDARDRE
jgi:hypothetical protein